jgi:hypothetical protein
MVKYNFKLHFGFYIVVGNLGIDKVIVNYLNITLETYQNKLIKEFNGYIKRNGNVYFKTKINTEVLDWINSLIIMNKLRGV